MIYKNRWFSIVNRTTSSKEAGLVKTWVTTTFTVSNPIFKTVYMNKFPRWRRLWWLSCVFSLFYALLFRNFFIGFRRFFVLCIEVLTQTVKPIYYPKTAYLRVFRHFITGNRVHDLKTSRQKIKITNKFITFHKTYLHKAK